MTPDAIFTITQDGTITGHGHLEPGNTFVVNTSPDAPFVGSIYACHLGHNATLELVGDGIHQIEIATVYTVQQRAHDRGYVLTAARPPRRDRSQGPEGRDAPGTHPDDGSNGDIYVGSGR